MISHPRTAILYYVRDLLSDEVDIGNRVYLHRPNNLDIYELPAMALSFEGEEIVPYSGSSQRPDEYLRTLTLRIEIIAENPNDPNKEFRVEEVLNSLARQVEVGFYNDVFFSKRLPTNTNSLSDPGLLSGATLVSVAPFELEITERVLMCQKLEFMLTYLDTIVSDQKYNRFESYLVEIRKINETEETVDPILIAAEGDVE